MKLLMKTSRDKICELQLIAEELRRKVITLIHNSGSGHTGGSLSSLDILTTLYFHVLNTDPANPDIEDRDRFILSKGHSVEGFYCTLSKAGFFSDEILMTYGKFNSLLAGHPTVNVPGVEISSGALGHGLSVGAGMALGAKMDDKKWRVFVLMGDGEQAEGSVYEGAMTAGHYQLDNLVAIIDRNNLQISGYTENVMSLEPLDKRWEAMGWEVLTIDGHDINSLLAAFNCIPVKNGKPHLLIANTVKGKGISFMENKAAWHHKVPDDEQYRLALQEIDKRIQELKKIANNEI